MHSLVSVIFLGYSITPPSEIKKEWEMKKLATVLSALFLVFCFISCTPDVINVSEVIIDRPDDTSLIIGESIQLSVTVVPSDASDKTITWQSSDNAITTVDSSGKVTAHAEGSVEITATASNGVSAVLSFQVIPALTLVELPDGRCEVTHCDKAVVDIQIPENVTKIGDNAFAGCSNLESIAIPESVTYIGVYAFFRCSSLKNIIIPESVTSIGESAFEGCTKLTTITIPTGVTTIELETFANCSSLTKIAIPENVTSIGNYAFYGCLKLSSIELPERVTSIGNGAFDSTDLTSITIPVWVTLMGKSVFYDCPKLTSIFCEAERKPDGWDADWLGERNEGITIHWGYTGE